MDHEQEIKALQETVRRLEEGLKTQASICQDLLIAVGVLTETSAMIIAEVAYGSPEREARLNEMLSGEEATRMGAVGQQADLASPGLRAVLEGKERHRDDIFSLARKALIRMILTRSATPPT